MEVEQTLNKLLPDELEKVKTLLEKLIVIKENSRSTNLDYQIRNTSLLLCPYCRSTSVVKNGHKNNSQRYKCKKCEKYFTQTTKTILHHTKVTYKQLIQFLECLIDLNTIYVTAQKTGLSKNEVYNLRIKITDILSNISLDNVLSEIVEADEKYVRNSFKGTRKNKMPRESRHSGSQNLTSGISDEQVCIIVAIDSNDNMVIKVAGSGPATTKMIEDVLGNKIKQGSILVTDSKSSYVRFAEKHNLILKQVPSKYHKTKDGYHLGEVNSLMSELELFIQNFRGLSTRHLQQYLDLFKYRKILRYTVEYLKQKKKTYDKVLLIQTKGLTKRQVCKTKMPIDIYKLYGVEFK